VVITQQLAQAIRVSREKAVLGGGEVSSVESMPPYHLETHEPCAYS